MKLESAQISKIVYLSQCFSYWIEFCVACYFLVYFFIYVGIQTIVFLPGGRVFLRWSHIGSLDDSRTPPICNCTSMYLELPSIFKIKPRSFLFFSFLREATNLILLNRKTPRHSYILRQ